MANDPIDTVGANIAFWCGQNSKIGATFNRAKSKMQVAARKNAEIIYSVSDIIPASITPNTIAKMSWDNGTTVQDSQVFTVDETTTESFTWSLHEGIKIGAKFSAKVPLIGKAGIETTVDFSSTQAWTNTTQKHWGYSATIPVPPKSVVHVYYIISEGHFSIPFTAPVEVRGVAHIDFANGKSGQWDISDLINNYKWSLWAFEATVEGTCTGVAGIETNVKTVQDGVDKILEHKLLI